MKKTLTVTDFGEGDEIALKISGYIHHRLRRETPSGYDFGPETVKIGLYSRRPQHH